MWDLSGGSVDLLQTIRSAWAFIGLVPRRILDRNDFGNLLIEDVCGHVWRICPEELSCKLVGMAPDELSELRSSPDWKMQGLVALATASLGEPGQGRCFCLKVPAVLGGRYAHDNLGTITVDELIAFSGYLASQIKDVPDGATIEVKFD
jgi:hypothetical protein